MLKTIQFFDQAAERDNWQSFDGQEENVLQEFIRLWNIRPGDAVLEPGCGTGRLTEVLAGEVGPGGQVVACDPSARMIERALSRGLGNRVHFHNLPLEHFLLPGAYFDRVICLNCFPHFNYPDVCLERIHKTLKHDGDFWICHTSSRSRINSLHRDGPPCIRDHQIPPLQDLLQLLEDRCFRIAGQNDTSESFWIHAKR